MNNLTRTQIYLPDSLRREIDNYRVISGDSLAGFLREAAVEHLKRKKKRKEDLKNLADQLGSLSGTRTRREANQWIKEIREDRRLSDERLEKRWAEVHKLVGK